MRKLFSVLALVTVSTSLQARADVPLLPQHRDGANPSANSGIVRFHGSVYASPCVLMMKSQIQDVEIGEISARRFHQAGDRSQPVRVSLSFKDCLKGASRVVNSTSADASSGRQAYTTGEQAVQLTFLGAADDNNVQLLRTTGSMQGAGLRLQRLDGETLDLSQTASPVLIAPGDSDIAFLASLEATETTVSAGDFTALLRLKLEYL